MQSSNEMRSIGISFGRSKLLQLCGNFKFKPELEPTVIVCLARRGFSEGFVFWICANTERRLEAILEHRLQLLDQF